MGHRIEHIVVADLLRQLNYSLQGNRKTKEGSHTPDRDAQFDHINTAVKAALAAGQPAISVDTKKQELVGDFKNAGRELRPKGQPEAVRVHDCKIPGTPACAGHSLSNFKPSGSALGLPQARSSCAWVRFLASLRAAAPR